MRIIASIALGGAAGSVARFLLGSYLHQRTGGTLPWGTFVVNVSGSLLLGFLMRLALASPAMSPELRALLVIGFCGGYTTFSTYSYETLALLEGGAYGRAATYATASVLVALAATYVGFALGREFVALRGRV